MTLIEIAGSTGDSRSQGNDEVASWGDLGRIYEETAHKVGGKQVTKDMEEIKMGKVCR